MLSAGSDKQALVLDAGARYVKAGLSEESAPRCVLRWDVADLMKQRCPLQQLHAYLTCQLHRLFFSEMLVNPRQRRVVLCEDVAEARDLRAVLVDVLFTQLKVASVTLVPAAVAALYATAQHTALMVDCGWAETRVLPVFKGMPLQYLYSTVRAGAASCCRSLCARVNQHWSDIALSMRDAEEILERACFVRPIQDPQDAADIAFPLGDDQVLNILGRWRHGATEGMFQDSQDSEGSIVECIEQVLHKLPMDVRAAMVENICVLGGTSMLPGFAQRLQQEVQESRAGRAGGSQSALRLVQPLFPRNILAWVGGSIYAGTTNARDKAVTASDYAARGTSCLPDWMSIAETELL